MKKAIRKLHDQAGTKGLILLDQVRTVDKVRLAKRLGAVSPKTLSATLTTQPRQVRNEYLLRETASGKTIVVPLAD